MPTLENGGMIPLGKRTGSRQGWTHLLPKNLTLHCLTLSCRRLFDLDTWDQALDKDKSGYQSQEQQVVRIGIYFDGKVNCGKVLAASECPKGLVEKQAG